MTWSGFRPSDDASEHGFPIPANMYAAAGLERALELNRQVWVVAGCSGTTTKPGRITSAGLSASEKGPALLSAGPAEFCGALHSAGLADARV
jgi:hypothetical protein